MGYKYHGRDTLIKTAEAITVLPSGLVQKKVTVVGRKKKDFDNTLSASESQAELGSSFFPYPSVSSGADLNNGFVQYDIVGYKKGAGSINSDINYKYRKLSSFIIENQYTPRTVNISVEVGVRSTIVLSSGTKGESQDTNGNTVTKTVYESPAAYDGQLIAYDEGGSEFKELFITEIYNYFDPDITVTNMVVYKPVVVVESVSSTYYGHFTEYITTCSLKIVRKVLSSIDKSK